MPIKKKKSTTNAKTAKTKEMSWKEAVTNVLTESSEDYMHYSAVADEIKNLKLRTNLGANPAKTVYYTAYNSSDFSMIEGGFIALPAKKTRKHRKTKRQDAVEQYLVNAYGLYWNRSKIKWTTNPAILGRQMSSETTVDFAKQIGVYILYDGQRILYAGRTTDRPLGVRLSEHTRDRLAYRWDRFSWFGLLQVNDDGSLKDSKDISCSPERLCKTLEAILLEAIEPPQNMRSGDELKAFEYIQIDDPQLEEDSKKDLLKQIERWVKPKD